MRNFEYSNMIILINFVKVCVVSMKIKVINFDVVSC